MTIGIRFVSRARFNRSQTSNPSMSGSIRSSRIRSGFRSETAARACVAREDLDRLRSHEPARDWPGYRWCRAHRRRPERCAAWAKTRRDYGSLTASCAGTLPEKGQHYSLAPSPAWQGIAPDSARHDSSVATVTRTSKGDVSSANVLPVTRVGQVPVDRRRYRRVDPLPLRPDMPARHNNYNEDGTSVRDFPAVPTRLDRSFLPILFNFRLRPVRWDVHLMNVTKIIDAFGYVIYAALALSGGLGRLQCDSCCTGALPRNRSEIRRY